MKFDRVTAHRHGGALGGLSFELRRKKVTGIYSTPEDAACLVDVVRRQVPVQSGSVLLSGEDAASLEPGRLESEISCFDISMPVLEGFSVLEHFALAEYRRRPHLFGSSIPSGLRRKVRDFVAGYAEELADGMEMLAEELTEVDARKLGFLSSVWGEPLYVVANLHGVSGTTVDDEIFFSMAQKVLKDMATAVLVLSGVSAFVLSCSDEVICLERGVDVMRARGRSLQLMTALDLERALGRSHVGARVDESSSELILNSYI